MTSSSVPSRPDSQWQSARVLLIENRTARIKSFSLAPQNPFEFYPGQHVDVKLTAEDGYTAMRSYSIASSPAEDEIEFFFELVPEGALTPLLHKLQPGDQLRPW